MSEMRTPNPSILFRLMTRAGKYYHLYAILIAQLIITYPGAFFGAQVIQKNADLSPEQFSKSVIASILLLTIDNIVMLVGAFYSTRDISLRLGQWKAGRPMSEGQVELRAWRQVNGIAWRYGIIAVFVTLIVVVIPLLLYQSFALKVTSNQLIYAMLGLAMASIVILISLILIIEFLLSPLRELLLPSNFDLQISGSVGFRIRQKFMLSILALIGFSILAIGPIGYALTFQAMNIEINYADALADMRSSFIVAAIIALTLGAVFSFSISESIAGPVRELVEIFNRVEKGDLKQRARVKSTDEVGELSIHFNRMIARIEELQATLEKRVEEQTEKLRASNEVGRIASTILDPDTLISRVVGLISKTFDYYYVAVFLVTENGRWAEIKDANGSAGEILKARRHRLQVGGGSMVGTCISDHEAKVAMDIGETAVRFNNPLLPNTRSELALPLIVGDRVIGALDVQSTREADFLADDIATLQNLASQVAISIENARLFREMDSALSELRQANQQYVGSAWEEKLQASKLEYSVKSNLVPSTEDTKDIAVNLNLRDQPIGYIHLQLNDEWSQEDQAWVESLATQVAISLENARLVEESNQSALRERLSASIIQKLWSTSSIDGILQAAARELGRALEASEATIELNMEE